MATKRKRTRARRERRRTRGKKPGAPPQSIALNVSVPQPMTPAQMTHLYAPLGGGNSAGGGGMPFIPLSAEFANIAPGMGGAGLRETVLAPAPLGPAPDYYDEFRALRTGLDSLRDELRARPTPAVHVIPQQEMDFAPLHEQFRGLNDNLRMHRMELGEISKAQQELFRGMDALHKKPPLHEEPIIQELYGGMSQLHAHQSSKHEETVKQLLAQQGALQGVYDQNQLLLQNVDELRRKVEPSVVPVSRVAEDQIQPLRDDVNQLTEAVVSLREKVTNRPLPPPPPIDVVNRASEFVLNPVLDTAMREGLGGFRSRPPKRERGGEVRDGPPQFLLLGDAPSAAPTTAVAIVPPPDFDPSLPFETFRSMPESGQAEFMHQLRKHVSHRFNDGDTGSFHRAMEFLGGLPVYREVERDPTLFGKSVRKAHKHVHTIGLNRVRRTGMGTGAKRTKKGSS